MPAIILGEHFDIGNREVYEDRCAARELTTPGGLRLALAAVADGVGGEDKGERAAQLALDTFFGYLNQSADTIVPRLLTRAIQAANQAVFEAVQASGSKTMSTTLAVAAVLEGKTLYVAHVGDSRVYFCRNGKLTQLTVDHTFSTMMNRLGELTPGISGAGRSSGALVRALGLRERVAVDIGFYVGTHDPELATARGLKGLPLQPGDSILVTSDGLVRESEATGEPYARPQEIARALHSKVGRSAAQTLVSYALGRNVDDNVSVALIQLPGGRGRWFSLLRRYGPGIAAGVAALALVGLALLSFIPPAPAATPTPIPIGTIFEGSAQSTLRTQETIQAGSGYLALRVEAGQQPSYLYLHPRTAVRFSSADDDRIALSLAEGGNLFIRAEAPTALSVAAGPSAPLVFQGACLGLKALNRGLLTASCYAGPCSYADPAGGPLTPFDAGQRLLLAADPAAALETISIPAEEAEAHRQALAQTEIGRRDEAACMPR